MDGKSESQNLIHLRDYEPISADILALLPASLVKKQLIVPLQKENGRVLVAAPKAQGLVKPSGLAMIVGSPVDVVVAPLEEIVAFIKIHYSESGILSAPAATPDSSSMTVVVGGPVPDIKESAQKEMSIPPNKTNTTVSVAGLDINPHLKKILLDASVNRASEILVVMKNKSVSVRERIRGNLVDAQLQAKLSLAEAKEIFLWLTKFGTHKTRQEIEWTEFRREFQIREQKTHCYFFLSHTAEADHLSVRLHPIREKIFSPSAWGMDPAQSRGFSDFLQKKNGTILFCSIDQVGLDENLHATANMLATPEKHVMVVEDFAQTWLPGIETFISNGDEDRFSQLLQIAFQHSPDILIANPLTQGDHFETCLTEAIRGRFVLGRSFASDTVDALMQLLGMGIEPYLLGSGLIGIVAKRTLRLNCPRCQTKDPTGRDRAKDLGVTPVMQPASFYFGKGCDACQNTGYDGETDIYEIFSMNDDVRVFLKSDTKPETFRSSIRSKGLLTLRQVALHKALNGQTSLAEVFRVTPK